MKPKGLQVVVKTKVQTQLPIDKHPFSCSVVFVDAKCKAKQLCYL